MANSNLQSRVLTYDKVVHALFDYGGLAVSVGGVLASGDGRWGPLALGSISAALAPGLQQLHTRSYTIKRPGIHYNHTSQFIRNGISMLATGMIRVAYSNPEFLNVICGVGMGAFALWTCVETAIERRNIEKLVREGLQSGTNLGINPSY